MNQQEEDRQRLLEDQLALEEALEEERRKRYEAQQRAANEIERLQREIDAMKESQKGRRVS